MVVVRLQNRTRSCSPNSATRPITDRAGLDRRPGRSGSCSREPERSARCRSDSYYLAAAADSTVIISTYETQRTAWAAMMRGDVDFLQEVSRDAVEFVEAEIERSRRSPSHGRTTFRSSSTSSIRRCGEREVRQAINEAHRPSGIVRDGDERPRPDRPTGRSGRYHWAYHSGASRPTLQPRRGRGCGSMRPGFRVADPATGRCRVAVPVPLPLLAGGSAVRADRAGGPEATLRGRHRHARWCRRP